VSLSLVRQDAYQAMVTDVALGAVLKTKAEISTPLAGK
jgi:hypothetical protein